MAQVFFAHASEFASLTNVFTVAGVPTDPAAVTLTITDPTGTATDYTYPASVQKTATGSFKKDVSTPLEGEWQYRWVGTGPASDVVTGSWTVLPTDLGKYYATPRQVKSRLGIPEANTDDDLEIHAACLAASRSVELACDRFFYRTVVEARTFEADCGYDLELGDFNDLVSVTALATDPAADGTYEVAWTAGTHYELRPLNPSAAPERRPYRCVRAIGSLTFPYNTSRLGRRDLVQITGVWGWPQVPAAIAEATRIMAAEFFKLKDAPFGIAAFGEFGAVRVRENPKAAALLADYQLHPVLMA